MNILDTNMAYLMIVAYLIVIFIVSMSLAIWVKKQVNNKWLGNLIIGVGLLIPMLSLISEGGPNIEWLRMNYEKGEQACVIHFDNDDQKIVVAVSAVPFGKLSPDGSYDKYRMDLIHAQTNELLNRLVLPIDKNVNLVYKGQSKHWVWFYADEWLAFDPFSGKLALNEALMTEKIVSTNPNLTDKIQSYDVDEKGRFMVHTTAGKTYMIDLYDFSLTLKGTTKRIIDRIKSNDVAHVGL